MASDVSDEFDARWTAGRRSLWIGRLLTVTLSQAPTAIEKCLVAILSEDPNGIVRHEAAFVLGELYERHIISGDLALQALMRAARCDASVVARHEAIESLAAFRGDQVRDLLLELASDRNDDIAKTAAIALEQWRL